MRRKTLLLSGILALVLPFFCSAQELLKIEDTFNPKCYPERIYNLQFVPKTEAYTFSKTPKDLWMGSAKEDAKKIVSLSDLNPTPTSLLGIQFINAEEFVYQTENGSYTYNLSKKKSTLLSKNPKDVSILEFANETGSIVYSKDKNLFLFHDDKHFQITSDGNSDIVYGETVHRSEFGISKGTFWSPQGNSLAFYRMDQSMVTDYPLVNTSTRIAVETPEKYPMAGMKSHHVSIGVYHLQNEQTVYLETYRKKGDIDIDEKEMFLTNITWSPDEKTIYIAKLNRAQNHMWLEAYDASTGAFISTLFEEQSSKYVEPEHGLFFLPDGSGRFIWMSERDNWNHLYLYNAKGELLKQLTQGEWMVTELASFDPSGANVFFFATKESPLESHLYRLHIKTGKITQITQAEGTHYVEISPSGKLFLDSYSNVSGTSSRTILLNDKGKEIKEIFAAPNPLLQKSAPSIELRSIEATDGTELFSRIIKPHDFDPEKKYPVLVYVYGGPHAQLVTNNWLGGSNLFHLFLAQQGYIVWTLDSRGSSNRGYAFESAIWHNLGTIELSDQMKGIEYLKTLPYVDTSRIGVDGWSYGGFMSLSLMLKHPGVFKVSTAGGPVIDWKWYEIMYGERYMGTPENNPEGYKNASLLNHIDSLSGRVMLIHGAQDPVVVWQHSLEFINACIKRGKLVDYFVYPDHEHNVSGRDRIHLFRKLFDYYETFLK